MSAAFTASTAAHADEQTPKLRERLGSDPLLPTGGDAGDHQVVLEVDDLSGGTTTQAFRVSVGFEAAPPPAAQAD